MKIHVDVDCTPEEARTFFGLPDVQPMQEALMSQIQERMQMALAQTDPDVLMKTWLPVGMARDESSKGKRVSSHAAPLSHPISQLTWGTTPSRRPRPPPPCPPRPARHPRTR